MKMDIRKAGLFKFIFAVFFLFALCSPKQSSAQYFLSGNGPIRKWSEIKDSDLKIVFPQDDVYIGLMTATYMKALVPFINRGFNNPVQRFPVLIQPSTIFSNGMVTWVPKRMELFSVPSRNTFATQWMKQLVTHEYRHVAQLSNLNVGITKVASYFIGQQAPGIVTAVLPTYFMEGDATLTETLYSTFGRGRQPNFTIGYRAMLENNDVIFWGNNFDKININKMLLGSYKDHVPSVYTAGYFIVGAASRYYGSDFWGKVLEFTGKYPMTVIPVNFAFNKYAKQDMNTLTKRIFGELQAHWHSHAQVENSATIIETKKTSYTTYTHPLPINDTLMLVLKSDLDKTNRFMAVDINTGKEQRLFYSGRVTSRPIIKNNTVYWTEYQPSLSWELKNSSIVKSFDISFGKKDKIKVRKNKSREVTETGVFYLTAMGDDGFAMISYNEQNFPELIITDTKFNIKHRSACKWFDCSFNGLTWDNKTGKIIGIILNDEGMWLGEFCRNADEFIKLTKPSYVTLNDLSATDGKLFFTSISSGKDEVHTLDIETGCEYKITESKFGSIASSLGSIWSQRTKNTSKMLMTTYSLKGYIPAHQKIDESKLKRVSYSHIPTDFLSFKYDSVYQQRIKLEPIINLDTVKIDSTIIDNFKVKKHRKGLNAFNIHSWAPIYLDFNRIFNEQQIAISAGAFFMSQNLLSDVVVGGTVGYYKKMLATSGYASYTGLPVKFSARFDYGGGYQHYQVSEYSEGANSRSQIKDKYLSISGGLSLPFNLSSGVNNRFLTLSANLSHTNTILDNGTEIKEGMEKMNLSVVFSNYKSRTRKQLGPRIGYTLEAYSSINPFDKEFGKVYGGYVKGFFPGIMRNHSFQVTALFQYQDEGLFNYTQKGMFPMGAESNFAAKDVYYVGTKYLAPLCYPDWGMGAIVYFRRINLKLLGEYAYSTPTNNYQPFVKTRNYYTYGGGLDFEVNIFRFSAPITFGFTLYKPNTSNTLGYTFNLGISL